MTEGEITVFPLGPENFGIDMQDYKKLTRLYCLNGGYHLRILPDGTVEGSRDEGDAYNVMRLKAVSIGVVVIEGREAALYLAMNEQGQLYGTSNLNDDCYFLEKLEENHYNTYMCQKYQDQGWYVGIKKNGRPKAGPRTHMGQKAIYFLPRIIDNTSK
ncbi:putative fibroblast growth factor 1 [Paramormyrops kingsleyae]|uniref:Fibroblast growth factor n=1 Tax=Paramormyrops kingsleyae TaxID=1676925 RepID=A0A3B3QRR2_9TELE|nr:putative fibroblast growth factor 1 [Paramormyrops kingsleyae]XP_023647323.1 putative fibroblast growth factor 1 [Paramormyrops kingsleyae]